MPATAAAAVTVAPETLTVTWLVAGGIIAQLLILIVFLVRVAWWLSHRFTLIDATLAASASTASKAVRTGASTPDPPPSNPTATRRKARPSGGLRHFWRSPCCQPNTAGLKPSPARA